MLECKDKILNETETALIADKKRHVKNIENIIALWILFC